MNYQFLYNSDFGYLRSYINNALKIQKVKILGDIKIKEKIINEAHYEFVWFIQDMSDEIVLLLLDDVGIDLLSKAERLADKLNALITSCKDYVNELFKNKKFCELIAQNINKLSHLLSSIDSEAINNFINYLKETDEMDLFYNKIYQNISSESQVNFVSNNVIPYEKLKSVIFMSSGKSCEYIIEHDSRIRGMEFSYNDIENLLVRKINMEPLIKQTDILDKIVYCISPNYYRNLVKCLEFSNDAEQIEIKRKKYVDKLIKDYNKNEQILTPFLNIYNDLKNTNINMWEIFNKYLPYLDMNYYTLLMIEIDDNNNDKKLYIRESHILISSMIIDYHFNEYYLNVFIDIKQLLEFNKAVKNLNSKDIELYNKILNIYDLSYEEKIKLHEQLKQINMLEKFYDDIRNSKNIAYNMFKEKNINKEKVKDKLNKEKSDKFDIDVYELNGEKFVALIKTGVFYNSEINNSSGCFSMIGDNCLGTYGTPDDRVTVVYGDFDINYIIHMFIEDSYSSPVTKDTTNVTNRVNLIMPPEEFQKNTNTYNEIIFNYGKNLGNDIITPKPAFILCYDEIKEIHKTSAKTLNLPILIINTKDYNQVKNNKEIVQRNYYTDVVEVEKKRIQR